MISHKLSEKIMKYFFLFSATISILAVALICYFLFSSGVPAILKIGTVDFLGSSMWRPSSQLYGIFPMIVGSILVTLGAVVIGVPIGILSAVFMAQFASPKLYKILKPLINLLAGIPSVVYGFFGLMVIVPFIRENLEGRGTSLLAASIVLAIMILPTIIGVCESAIRAVPSSYYEGALALGATHERSVFKTVLPACNSGVAAGVILGIGRAIGETMAVMMVAGNQPVIPDSILKGVRTLTTNIAMEMGYAQDLHREALIATAMVLFIFILIINLTFNWFKRRH